MTYKIARDGQEFGPYSLSDVQRYVGTGNILLTDLACAEGSTEWIPVSQVVGTVPVPSSVPPVGMVPGTVPFSSQYPDPPNLNWGLVILFAVLTCGLFVYVWDIVQTLWVKKVQPNTQAMPYYIGGIALLMVSVVLTVATAKQGGNSIGSLLNLVGVIILILGRFKLRSSLEEHYNTVEPIGLSLSGVMTFFFGPFYFQYHFNKINQMKRSMPLINPGGPV